MLRYKRLFEANTNSSYYKFITGWDKLLGDLKKQKEITFEYLLTKFKSNKELLNSDYIANIKSFENDLRRLVDSKTQKDLIAELNKFFIEDILYDQEYVSTHGLPSLHCVSSISEYIEFLEEDDRYQDVIQILSNRSPKINLYQELLEKSIKSASIYLKNLYCKKQGKDFIVDSDYISIDTSQVDEYEKKLIDKTYAVAEKELTSIKNKLLTTFKEKIEAININFGNDSLYLTIISPLLDDEEYKIRVSNHSNTSSFHADPDININIFSFVGEDPKWVNVNWQDDFETYNMNDAYKELEYVLSNI